MGVRQLRQLVATLPIGERIPSERQLAAEWGVARMTVRAAIDVLVQSGQLERRAGSGTYVSEPPYAKMLGLTSFTADMLSRGSRASSETLAFTERPAGPALAERLGIDEDEPVYEFTRLRCADNQPMAVEMTSIPRSIVPGLQPDDLDGSLYTLLTERYGVVLGEASSTISPLLAGPEIAARLELDENSPCLRIDMAYFDSRRRPVMTSKDIYSGRRYRLQVTINSQAFERGAQRNRAS